jgi:hypothetical protein
MSIYGRGKVFTEPLPSKGVRRNTQHTETDRQQDDLIRLLLFFKTRKAGYKCPVFEHSIPETHQAKDNAQHHFHEE